MQDDIKQQNRICAIDQPPKLTTSHSVSADHAKYVKFFGLEGSLPSKSQLINKLNAIPGMYYDQKLKPNSKIEIFPVKPSSKWVKNIKVRMGPITLQMTLLENQQSKLSPLHTYSQLPSRKIVFMETSDRKKWAIKCLRLLPNMFIESLVEAIRQYWFLKLASALGIGPKVSHQVMGFDMVVNQDCVQFAMQCCQPLTITSFETVKLLKQKMAALHALNIVHRDIKPMNSGWSQLSKEPVLIDYGLCEMIQQDPGYCTETFFAGTISFCTPAMSAASLEKTAKMVDLYYNDVYGLQLTIKQCKESGVQEEIRDSESDWYVLNQKQAENEQENKANQHGAVTITCQTLFIKYCVFNMIKTPKKVQAALQHSIEELHAFSLSLPNSQYAQQFEGETLKSYMQANHIRASDNRIARRKKGHFFEVVKARVPPRSQSSNSFDRMDELDVTLRGESRLTNSKPQVKPVEKDRVLLLSDQAIKEMTTQEYYWKVATLIDLTSSTNQFQSKVAVCKKFIAWTKAKKKDYTVQCPQIIQISQQEQTNCQALQIVSQRCLDYFINSKFGGYQKMIPVLTRNIMTLPFADVSQLQSMLTVMLSLGSTTDQSALLTLQAYLLLEWCQNKVNFDLEDSKKYQLLLRMVYNLHKNIENNPKHKVMIQGLQNIILISMDVFMKPVNQEDFLRQVQEVIDASKVRGALDFCLLKGHYLFSRFRRVKEKANISPILSRINHNFQELLALTDQFTVIHMKVHRYFLLCENTSMPDLAQLLTKSLQSQIIIKQFCFHYFKQFLSEDCSNFSWNKVVKDILSVGSIQKLHKHKLLYIMLFLTEYSKKASHLFAMKEDRLRQVKSRFQVKSLILEIKTVNERTYDHTHSLQEKYRYWVTVVCIADFVHGTEASCQIIKELNHQVEKITCTKCHQTVESLMFLLEIWLKIENKKIVEAANMTLQYFKTRSVVSVYEKSLVILIANTCSYRYLSDRYLDPDLHISQVITLFQNQIVESNQSEYLLIAWDSYPPFMMLGVHLGRSQKFHDFLRLHRALTDFIQQSPLLIYMFKYESYLMKFIQERGINLLRIYEALQETQAWNIEGNPYHSLSYSLFLRHSLSDHLLPQVPVIPTKILKKVFKDVNLVSFHIKNTMQEHIQFYLLKNSVNLIQTVKIALKNGEEVNHSPSRVMRTIRYYFRGYVRAQGSYKEEFRSFIKYLTPFKFQSTLKNTDRQQKVSKIHSCLYKFYNECLRTKRENSMRIYQESPFALQPYLDRMINGDK